ncbi:sterol 3-beta-glucosyltransferase UGT80B1 isoform X2 [Aristolochia californica]|uniref:sterol 3-beta-glucosyltransferase UGT80B1 isoform X2 n=1 Tax=Aristolochia californica TaxID=171875 RepID=UPI0035DB0FAB
MESNGLGETSDHLVVETGDMRAHMETDLLVAEQVTQPYMGTEDCWTADPLHKGTAVGECRSTVSKSGATVVSSHKPGLEHSKTAPANANVYKDVLYVSQEHTLPRSKTEKKETPKYNLKLDRLPEHKKKELIENLIRIQNDGTVEVDISRSASVASELLKLDSVDIKPIENQEVTLEANKSVPKLKIAILVVGTRGDVQPFLAIAKRLQEFGHTVRLATHSNFRIFVKSAGVDFYPLGGDPRILAGYMARNKGFLPSGPSEISEQRKQLKTIIDSLLPACIEPDLETGSPFRAQAIIANPPAYGHAHVAEALGVPLHIFFTMPWTPTHEFPHPLARVPQSAGYRLSYLVVDLIVWWSIRGFINDFRKRKLNLPPIAYFSTYHGSISHLPTGYMWSPHLVPKPSDWGTHVDVVGFCFLNLGSKFEPQRKFVEWIKKGPKPIYVGFGSMPLEDAEKTTTIILEALRDTGQRGIIDKGWGDLGNFCTLQFRKHLIMFSFWRTVLMIGCFLNAQQWCIMVELVLQPLVYVQGVQLLLYHSLEINFSGVTEFRQ